MSNARSGFLFVVLAVCGYSFLPVWLNGLLATGMPQTSIALWRFGIAALVLWIVSLMVQRPAAPAAPRQRVRMLAVGTLLSMAALTAFYGLPLIPAGTYVVIFYTYPAITALLGVFLGDRLTGWGWAALALTLVGIALTAPDFSSGLRGENFSGVMLALLNALLVAVYFVINARVLRGYNAPVHATAYFTSGAFLVLLVVGLFVGYSAPPTREAWFNLIMLVAVSTILPTFSLNIGIQRLGPARAAILGSFEPVLTASVAWVFLGQVMQPIQWVGGAVIIASVILLQTLGASRKPQPPAEPSPDAAVIVET